MRSIKELVKEPMTWAIAGALLFVCFMNNLPIWFKIFSVSFFIVQLVLGFVISYEEKKKKCPK